MNSEQSQKTGALPLVRGDGEQPSSGVDAAGATELPAQELTTRQTLSWLEEHLHGGVAVGQRVALFEISAAIDGARFRRAFRAVADASDALRTVVVDVEGEPRQRVLLRAPAELALVDLSEHAQPQASFAAWLEAQRQRRLPLAERGFESALVKLGEERYVWYLCVHAIVADSWSCALIYQHTLSAYLGMSAFPLPQFTDHVVAQALYRGSAEYRAAEAFWQKRLQAPLEGVRFY